MTLIEAIKARHSVRNYKHQPLSEEVIDILQKKIDECNTLGNLHIQLVTNEKKAFFELLNEKKNGKHQVKASITFSMIGYTKMDLGIAKLHFEIGAGKENFEWA